jgi:hypothetical protein
LAEAREGNVRKAVMLLQAMPKAFPENKTDSASFASAG